MPSLEPLRTYTNCKVSTKNKVDSQVFLAITWVF